MVEKYPQCRWSFELHRFHWTAWKSCFAPLSNRHQINWSIVLTWVIEILTKHIEKNWNTRTHRKHNGDSKYGTCEISAEYSISSRVNLHQNIAISFSCTKNPLFPCVSDGLLIFAVIGQCGLLFCETRYYDDGVKECRHWPQERIVAVFAFVNSTWFIL